MSNPWPPTPEYRLDAHQLLDARFIYSGMWFRVHDVRDHRCQVLKLGEKVPADIDDITTLDRQLVEVCVLSTMAMRPEEKQVKS